MVRHWLRTPVNGYLGHGYGHDIKSLLQLPLSTPMADSILQKLMTDVPILTRMPAGSVNLYTETVGNDQLRLIVSLAGAQVSIDSAGNVR